MFLIIQLLWFEVIKNIVLFCTDSGTVPQMLGPRGRRPGLQAQRREVWDRVWSADEHSRGLGVWPSSEATRWEAHILH